MRDYIEVDKNLMPYSFDILLGAEMFNLAFKWNERAAQFTCTLSKDDEVLVYDEPLIYGSVLFASEYQSGVFPPLDLVPWDESEQETEVTFDNFGKTVFLTVKMGGDDSE